MVALISLDCATNDWHLDCSDRYYCWTTIYFYSLALASSLRCFDDDAAVAVVAAAGVVSVDAKLFVAALAF